MSIEEIETLVRQCVIGFLTEATAEHTASTTSAISERELTEFVWERLKHRNAVLMKCDAYVVQFSDRVNLVFGPIYDLTTKFNEYTNARHVNHESNNV